MTYNIRKGLGATGLKSALPDLREAIRSVGADVVFLQEVMGRTSKGTHRRAGHDGDQLEFLADSVWSHHAYGRNAIHSRGHHGNAILSQLPFQSFENIDISTNPLERRGLLHGVVSVKGRRQPIHLLCLHLNLLESGRKRQVASVAKRVRDHVPDNGPLLIAGDFNDWRGTASAVLEKELGVEEAARRHRGRHQKTFPAWLPMLALDRIYYRDMKLVHVEEPDPKRWRSLSDHLALIAEFDVP